MFLDHIECSVAAASALVRFIENPRGPEGNLDAILTEEHEGDTITRETHELLDRTFITDFFDKPDIERLITQLDDILDEMKTIAKRIDAFSIAPLPNRANPMASVVHGMVEELRTLIAEFPHLTSEQLTSFIQNARSSEEEADNLLDEVIRELARNAKVDAKQFVALKEVFERLEKVTDRCQDVVDTISSIVRKGAR